MAEISKLVANRRAWGLMVTEAGRVHTDRLDAFLTDALDGRAGFDAAQARPFILAVCDWLEEQTLTMADAEKNYALEQADDVAPRSRRDDLQGRARQTVMSLRSRVEELVGPDASRRFAIPKVTPSDADELADTLETVALAMEKRPISVVDPLGMPFDSVQVAARLRALAGELRGALEKVAIEKREFDGALVARDRAVAHWKRAYRAVAGILSNLFLAADETELAERVRPTERRSTGIEKPAPDPAAEPV